MVVLGYLLLIARDRPPGMFLHSYMPQGLLAGGKGHLFMAMLKKWLGRVTQMFATISVIPTELCTSNVPPKSHIRCLVTSWAPLGDGETIRERTQHVVCGSLGCALKSCPPLFVLLHRTLPPRGTATGPKAWGQWTVGWNLTP